ncbi:hypothetical protein Tco_1138315 [Tanacetum coccineum]
MLVILAGTALHAAYPHYCCIFCSVTRIHSELLQGRSVVADPADYPADRDDDDEEEEEEEHPAPVDFVPPVLPYGPQDILSDEPYISTLILRKRYHHQTPNRPYYIEITRVCLPLRCSTSRELTIDIDGILGSLVGAIDEIAPTTIEGVNQRDTDLATIVEEETTSINDREREAKMAHEAWGLSMDANDYARSDVMSLRTIVVAQSALISELQSADHRRQSVISELLTSDHKRQVQLTKTLRLLKGLQTQMVDFQRQHRPVEGPSQPDAPGEAGSSS